MQVRVAFAWTLRRGLRRAHRSRVLQSGGPSRQNPETQKKPVQVCVAFKSTYFKARAAKRVRRQPKPSTHQSINQSGLRGVQVDLLQLQGARRQTSAPRTPTINQPINQTGLRGVQVDLLRLQGARRQRVRLQPVALPELGAVHAVPYLSVYKHA